MQSDSKTEIAQPGSLHPVVRARHPWQQMWDNKAKLKAARKEAKRRYERERPVRNDEYRRLKLAATNLKVQRIKAGIPTDLPKMKPWDYAKGKCPNGEVSQADS
jgi:hypothetical protein